MLGALADASMTVLVEVGGSPGNVEAGRAGHGWPGRLCNKARVRQSSWNVQSPGPCRFSNEGHPNRGFNPLFFQQLTEVSLQLPAPVYCSRTSERARNIFRMNRRAQIIVRIWPFLSPHAPL